MTKIAVPVAKTYVGKMNEVLEKKTVGGKVKMTVKKEMEGVTMSNPIKTPVKKPFSCQFYLKDSGGCNVKCTKNRNICCYDCLMYERCIEVKEINDQICQQVKEAK